MAEGEDRNSVNNSSSDAVPGRVGIILCQPCSRKDKQAAADVFCSNCEEFQCNECSKIHSVYAFMKNHQLQNASDVKSKPASFDMQGMDKCEQHGELLKFFCGDDKLLCCSTCAIVKHRQCHSVVEVQEIAENTHLNGSKIKQILQEVHSKATMAMNRAHASEKQLQDDIKSIFVNIRRMRDDVNKIFDQLENYVTKATDDFQKNVCLKLTQKQANSKKHQADANQSLEFIDNVYQNGTPSQQFIIEQKMKGHVNKLRSEVEETHKTLQTVTASFKFDDTLQLPPLPVSDTVPGKLILDCTSSDDKIPIMSMDQGKKTLPKSQNPVMTLTKIASIELKKTGEDDEEPTYTGMDFLPDGRLVSVDNYNMKCLIYNEKLEKVGTYQLSYIPQCVVAVSADEVAITSGNYYKIDFLRISKSNEITLKRSVEVKTKYYSFCLKDNEHFVTGTADDTRPARIVSLAGEETDFNINFPNKTYPIGTSACIYIRNSDKLVLSDRYDHNVYIYDVPTNTSVVVKNKRIKEPLGVAVGLLDSILVCSKETDSVVQISQSGDIVASFELDMKYPASICISKDQSVLAVSNNCSGELKLQLFKLTGSNLFMS